MYHLHNLCFVLSIFDNAACTDWLTKLKRYRVYVTQDKQCSMPENTLGYYHPGTGRWGAHIIGVNTDLPKNLKITVLCHQMAHFIEYVNNKSKHKKDRTELECHNSEWKAIYSELLYSFYTSGLLNPDKLEDELEECRVLPPDLAIVSHILGIRDFGQYDIYDEDELFYYNNWNSEMESPFDSYDDEDIDPNY